jgi:CcmD family protein
MIMLMNMPLTDIPYLFGFNIVILSLFLGYGLWVLCDIYGLPRLPKSPLVKIVLLSLAPLLILIFGVVILTWSNLENEGRGHITVGEIASDQRSDRDLKLRGDYVVGSLIEGSDGNPTVFEMLSDNITISVITSSDIPGRFYSGSCDVLLEGRFNSDDIFWSEKLTCVPDDNVAYLLSAYGISWILLFGYTVFNSRKYKELKDILNASTIVSEP